MAIAAILAITFISSCKKKDTVPEGGTQGPATVSFTINGDGFVNQQVSISSTAGSSGNESVYNSKWNFTHGHIADDKNAFTFYTNDKQTGAQLLGKDFSNNTGPFTYVSILLELSVKDGNRHTYIYQDKTYAGDPLPPGSSITITKYGNVDGWVEGDFQGSLFNNENLKIIKMTNGHFKMPRSKDVK
jgi:hypothetical protein